MRAPWLALVALPALWGAFAQQFTTDGEQCMPSFEFQVRKKSVCCVGALSWGGARHENSSMNRP